METSPIDQDINVEQTTESKKSNNAWKIILLVLLVGFMAVACTLITQLFILPLAEPLFIQEGTATPVPTEAGGVIITPNPTEEMEEPADTPKASACKETGTMTFLVLGVDMPYTDPPKGADAVRLVEIDFNTMEATMIAVPRDLWVSTPALNEQNIYSNRIGLTYHYAKQDVPEGSDETVYATTVLAQTLYDNFGFVPDHYITLHLDKFEDIVDALGGITVDVPQMYESVSYVYTPGSLTMNGDQALEYASNLINDDTVWERLERQERVIDAIIAKVSSPSVITKLPALIGQFNETVTTDLSISTMTDLSCLANDISVEDVQMIELDPPYVTPQDDSPVLQPDDELIIELFEDVFN